MVPPRSAPAAVASAALARFALLLLLAASLPGCWAALDLSGISLPPGFSISLYAKGLHKARSLALSGATHPGGAVIVYVSSRDFDQPSTDKIWALVDKDGDGRVDFTTVVFSGYRNPNGIAWRKGALFVGVPTRILRLDNIDSFALNRKPYKKAPATVFDALPDQSFHESRYLSFGPDGKLYFGVGIPCDVCAVTTYRKNATSPRFTYGSLYRMNADGSGVQKWASGLRNSVGFDFHPTTGELYFSDNAADMMGADKPDDKLGHAPKQGSSFGFPRCHTTGVGGPTARRWLRRPGVGRPLPDPSLNPGQRVFNCSRAAPLLQALGPHVAPLGMRFYRAGSGPHRFPPGYTNSILVAEHGSGGLDNAQRLGYRVARVVLDATGTRVTRHEVFASWLLKQGSPSSTLLGRPVDVLQLQDGSLLISDDYAHCVYRVTYKAPSQRAS